MFWWWFPLAIIVAAMALSSGLSGGYWWTPAFLFLSPLPPQISFLASLFIMSIGFFLGALSYAARKQIAWPLVLQYSKVIIPGVILGTLISNYIDYYIIIILFGFFVLLYGVYFFEYNRRASAEHFQKKHQHIEWRLGAFGGFLQGVITVGSTVVILHSLLNHKECHHHAKATGTAVVLAFVASSTSVLTRLVDPIIFNSVFSTQQPILWQILLFAIPGEIIGSQIGPYIAHKLPQRIYRCYIGILLVIIGLLTLYTAINR